MGFEKGQQIFCEDLDSSSVGGEIVNNPIKSGVSSDNTDVMSLGPVLNFTATNVTNAEKTLREVISDFKVQIELLVPKCKNAIEFNQTLEALNRLVPPVFQAYDTFVASVIETSSEKVSCQKSCSHCCSHYVTSVEPFELLYLHAQLKDKNEYAGKIISLHRRISLFKSLLIQSENESYAKNDEEEDKALYRYFLRGQNCPFLKEGGECGVYEHRPMSCRMFYSLSHPALCKGKNVIAPGNRNFLIELPDDIEADLARVSALFSEFNLPVHFFEGLLEINEKFGQFETSSTQSNSTLNSIGDFPSS